MNRKFTLLVGATLVAALVVGFAWYTTLPIMQVDLDGNCRRVLVVEQGKEVARPCGVVAGKLHLTEYVAH